MTESQQPSVYTSILITLVPALLVVALRFYPARLRKVTLWWDDYLAVIALIPALGYDATAFFLITKGLGLHLEDVPVPAAEATYYQLLGQEIQEHTYTLAIGAAQLSLLALYWRLFSSSSPGGRLLILAMTGFVLIWTIVRLLVAVFQCYPPQFFWDKSIDGKCTVDPAKFFLVSVSTHLVIDVGLIILPAMQINRLSLPNMQKAAVGVMFMFGITICVASIMMMIVSVNYDSYAADVMWNCAPVLYWSAVEVHLSIIACSLPLLRPVMRDIGGWWGQNFSSRKGRSEHNMHSDVQLRTPNANRSDRRIHRDKDSDSTHNFAESLHSSSAGNHGWDDTESNSYVVPVSSEIPRVGGDDKEAGRGVRETIHRIGDT